MRTVARVHDVRGDRAWLACETVAAGCAGCDGGRGCALRWLDQSGSGTLEVAQQEPGGRLLARGDAVIVEVSDGELLRAAMRAYLPPLAGLLAGPVLLASLGVGGEPGVVIAAGIGLALGWATSRALLRRAPPRFELRATERP